MTQPAPSLVRVEPAKLRRQIEYITANPIFDGLLQNVGGFLAVLNEARQIIAINETFLHFLGIEDPAETLGLRPGEVVRCVHAAEVEESCGFSPHCATCGAAIAMVTSLGLDRPVERICALTAKRDGTQRDLALRVRSHPIRIEDERFLLLFLQDITREQQRAALERSFFHDVSNILAGLWGACQLLDPREQDPDLLGKINRSVERLTREVELQKLIFRDDTDLNTRYEDTNTTWIFEELEALFARHPAARDHALEFRVPAEAIEFPTDVSLCLRVLSNMIVNALEASPVGRAVEIAAEQKDNAVVFSVWNGSVIPTAEQLRIFQRNFSTKEGAGRGFGTYSMKLFGEGYLGGKVAFTSPLREGTEFRLELPL